jgi:hypothetical protein
MNRHCVFFFCVFIGFFHSAVTADEAETRRMAVATLNELSQTTPVLSRQLEPLSSYSTVRATTQKHQALMTRLDSLLVRAQTTLEREETDPRTLRELETKFRDVRSQLRGLDRRMRSEINQEYARSARARNEAGKIKGFFQGWQEKANQVDQQLTAILRMLKDLGRVGVGGSDLGSS